MSGCVGVAGEGGVYVCEIVCACMRVCACMCECVWACAYICVCIRV